MIDGMGRGAPPRLATTAGQVTPRKATPFEVGPGPSKPAMVPQARTGIAREMAAEPPVDASRVAALRSAMISGHYKVDPELIAAKMIAFGRGSNGR